MERFFWICLGGAIGTGVRYLVGLWAGERFSSPLSFATLVVNVAGCFLIALVMHVAIKLGAFPVTLRLALTTGFMGGLTTYSSFNYETSKLLAEGAPHLAAVNVGVTLIACLAAGFLGVVAARLLVGR